VNQWPPVHRYFIGQDLSDLLETDAVLRSLLEEPHLKDQKALVFGDEVVAPAPFGCSEENEEDALVVTLDEGLIVGCQIVVPRGKWPRYPGSLQDLLQFMEPGVSINARQVLLTLLHRTRKEPCQVLGDFFEV
jgi:hypothetical protein